jgi:hypothetical protein
MGFSFSSKKDKSTSPNPAPETANTIANTNQSNGLQLSKPEIEAMLGMIQASTFKGDQVEHVYNLVLKLQEYYSTLSD